MKFDPNEPAFPVTAEKFVDGVWKSCQRGGIPIRLHIATEMAKGLLANPHNVPKDGVPDAETWKRAIAIAALGQADALIARYNSEQK